MLPNQNLKPKHGRTIESVSLLVAGNYPPAPPLVKSALANHLNTLGRPVGLSLSLRTDPTDPPMIQPKRPSGGSSLGGFY